MMDRTQRERGRARILQLHPTRYCNLACRHCYSRSGSDATESLRADVLGRTVADAARLGYEVASFSGGEPLLYPELARVLDHAKVAGLRTAVATNGFPLTPGRARQLCGRVDLVTVSVDGLEQEHNETRGSRRAFAAVERALAVLANARVPFGLIATLSATNWHVLPELVALAVDAGAQLFHAHALERAGRAVAAVPEAAFLSEDDLERAFVLLHALAAELGDAIAVHGDLLHRRWVLSDPTLVEAHTETATLPRVLVVEPSGRVVPIAYGFADRYAVGNVNAASLATMCGEYRQSGSASLRHMCESWFDDLARCPELRVFNWTERIVAWSAAMPRDGRTPSDTGSA
jgi:MoaA/NifB/PqqE/SkfB family radical SAM enzyme